MNAALIALAALVLLGGGKKSSPTSTGTSIPGGQNDHSSTTQPGTGDSTVDTIKEVGTVVRTVFDELQDLYDQLSKGN